MMFRHVLRKIAHWHIEPFAVLSLFGELGHLSLERKNFNEKSTDHIDRRPRLFSDPFVRRPFSSGLVPGFRSIWGPKLEGFFVSRIASFYELFSSLLTTLLRPLGCPRRVLMRRFGLSLRPRRWRAAAED